MIPSHLKEHNPYFKHYRRRIWKNQILNVKTFYSPTIGWFDVTAMWHNVEYRKNKTSTVGSHWLHYNTMRIETYTGDFLIMREEYLAREGAFKNLVPGWKTWKGVYL